jgi:16S rRNA processing protein RimM
MILEKEIFKAGKINKTHGVNGELNCAIDADTIDRAEYMVLDMDGIFVPFFISNIRVKSSNSVLLTLEDIETETDARNLVGKDIYLPIHLMSDEDMLSYEYFVGFTVVNGDEKLGEISFVDDQTVNILFGITAEDGDILLPAVEDFIMEVDNENKILFGVCAGLAKYFNTDVWFIRCIAISLAVIHPCVWILYLFVWLFTPIEESEYKYRNTTVVETIENLFEIKLIQSSYIGKMIYVKSEESLYLMTSNDYKNDIKRCWKKVGKIETKDVNFNTPIFVYLKGQNGEFLECICNGVVTDSDNNIWIKTGDGLHHIDYLSSESKNYVLEKLKQD